MRTKLPEFFRGYIKVEVRGERITALINDAVAEHYLFWNIQYIDHSKIQLCMRVNDFFRIRPLLKRTGCRIHVVGRYGFPFFLDRLMRRKLFLIGAVSFIVGLYLLSSLIWNVQVIGNEKIPGELIKQVAYEQGIRPLQWKFRLKSPEHLSKQLMSKLPGASWVGVEIKGTQARIEVVESIIPEKKPLMNPRNLIASTDAVITQILAEKGRAVVQPNMRVRKGDILISGTIGGGDYVHNVVAEGVVRGLVWHEYDIEVPLVHRYKVYTGELKNRIYAVIGNRALKLTGYGELKFERHETESRRHALQWRNVVLPIGWMSEKVREVDYEVRTLSPEEAVRIAILQAEATVLSHSEKKTVIKEQKVLQQRSENGTVYIKVLFETEEEISQEQPIIQGE